MTSMKAKRPVPRLARWIYRLFIAPEDRRTFFYSVEKVYQQLVDTDGAFAAYRWYWFQLICSLPGFFMGAINGGLAMLYHDIKRAVQLMRKNRLFTFLSVMGLSVSIAATVLIYLHIQYELSFDKFFPKSEQIYRIQVNSQYGTNFRQWAVSAPGLGPMLKERFPEVESAVRIIRLPNQILKISGSQSKQELFEESGGAFADNAVVGVFDLQFIKGNPQTALKLANSMVLTRSLAQKFFGDKDPLGLTIIDSVRNISLAITGIIKDIPKNSHLPIDYLVSLPTIQGYLPNPDLINHRTWKVTHTYVLIPNPQGVSSFYKKAPAFMTDFLSKRPGRKEVLKLQPIASIHLHSRLEGEMGPNGDIKYIWIFAAVGVLLLLIAAVNFVNLATALSLKRMMETGIRKVIGAQRFHLIKQMLVETLLLNLVAVLGAAIIFILVLPFYNDISSNALTLKNMLTFQNIASLLLLLLGLTFLAGWYPALFISRFNPVHVLRGTHTPSRATGGLRRYLVVFQFVVSIILIFCTFTINRQLNFLHSQELGFQKENLIAVRLMGALQPKITGNQSVIKNQLLKSPDITHVSLTSSLPGQPFSNERITPVYIKDKNTLPMLRLGRVDDDFIKTMGLEIILGRDFLKDTENKYAYLISESARDMLNLEKPLGIKAKSDIHAGLGTIVGVFKDFHYASLQHKIEPLVLEYLPDSANYLLVRTNSSDISRTLAFIRTSLNEILPDQMFRYRMVDEVFNSNYYVENRIFDLFKVFTALAIFVACLGLFGLTLNSVQIRVKEIGIRKVLGARISHIIYIISKSFITWVLTANVVALPLAYILMRKWLQNFAYHTSIEPDTFIVSAILAVIIAVTTVGFISFFAARQNPVNSIKQE